jgi:mannose-6-phosphate isomerase-like protein (cupin superfamily)
MKIATLLFALFCMGFAVAQGPQPRPVEPNKFGYWSTSGIKAASQKMKAGERPEVDRLNRGNHNFNLNFRNKSGSPEIHMNWTDIFIVQDGEATLIYAGRVEGGTERRPGEIGGGKIVGGSTQKLVAGDIASVPAGMPHMFELENGKTITYFTVKVAKQDMPSTSSGR